jgi:hypothetical protein
MRIIFLEKYQVWRLSRMPYPKAIEFLRLGKGYIISTCQLIGSKM